MVLALAVLVFQVQALPQSVATLSPRDTTATVQAPAVQKVAQAEPTAVQESSFQSELLVSQPALRLATFLLRRPGAEMFLVTAENSAAVAPWDRDAFPSQPLPAGASSTPLLGATRSTSTEALLPAASTSPLLSPGRANTQKLWYVLIAAGHGAAAFDTWTTRRVISRGLGRELNPMLRPFAGNGGLYAAMQVGPGLFDLLGRRMMRSERAWVRKIWWLPQVAGTASSLFSGVHNLRVYNRRAPGFAH